MKRVVLLIRHAHAAVASEGRSAHDRPLTAKGVAQAASLGVWLNEERGVRLGRVLASSAARAVATADTIAVTVCGSAFEPPVVQEALLYNSSLDAFLSIIAASPASVDVLAVVGHNPTISDAATWLTGSSIGLSTVGGAEIEVPVESWADIATAAGRGVLRALRDG